MYKIYSGILSNRIIKVAVSNEWISSQQKGFLPGLKGIQEHTFLLESAITEAKKRHDDLHIIWLDLANAFGSLPHSTLNKLFESLPLPVHTSAILKDMYTNTICEYKDVMVQPTSGVRQGDCLSPIYNLASNPII